MSSASGGSAVWPELGACIAPETLARARASQELFVRADPFRHVVIDGFFEPGFAERLLADFPAFDPALAKKEIYEGGVGQGGSHANSRDRSGVSRTLRIDRVAGRSLI